MWAAVGYCFLGLLLLLLILLLIPIGTELHFLDEFTLCIRLLGIRVFRFSSADAPKKGTHTSSKKVTKADKPGKESPLQSLSDTLKADGVNAVVQYLQKGAVLAAGAARRLFAAITVDKLVVKLTVASADAAATAQDTGKICAVLYPAVAALQNVIKIRKREVTVTPDFLAEKGKAEVIVKAHALPMKLLCVALYIFRQYSSWRSSIKNRDEEEVGYGK